MRVIITGGTGLLGRAIGAELASSGYEVFALSRNPARAGEMPAGVTVRPWDARSAAGWGELVEGAQAIVNLAGAGIAGDGVLPARWSARRKQVLRQSRALAGQAVRQAIGQARQKPAFLFQISGINYYAQAAGDAVLTEESPPGDDFLAQVCRQSWESGLAELEAQGVRVVVGRTAPVLTPRGGVLGRLVFPFRFFAGGRLGSGRQWVSWIHLADLVQAVLFFMKDQAQSGPFNLAAPNPVTNQEFARTLGRVLGRPAWFPVPAWALRLALGELSMTLLGSLRVMPSRLQAAGFPFSYPELEPALRHLLARPA